MGMKLKPSSEGVESGNLCMKFPWPGMLCTTYGDHERCRLNYFSTYENLYFTGDGCLRDEQGNYRITGRVDDVLNVSGHRIGTAEVENPSICTPECRECGSRVSASYQGAGYLCLCDLPGQGR